MQKNELTLSDGRTLEFEPLCAWDAIKFEEAFGADSMANDGTTAFEKTLGMAWLSHNRSLEEEISFEDFCKSIPLEDMGKVSKMGGLFLKKKSASTES